MGLFLSLSFRAPELFVWCICLGFNIAMVAAYIIKRAEGELIKGLLDKGATSEENAFTLGELGLEKKRLIKLFLRDGSTLRRMVVAVSGERGAVEKGAQQGRQELDFCSVRFYIPESMMRKANSMKKGVLRWYLLPIFAVVSVGISIGITYLIPIFLNW